ncbi:hypothetical protein BH20VER3_BH20VER3_21520 [soil metagenome]
MGIFGERVDSFRLSLALIISAGSLAWGAPPYGLDSRAPIGPYLNGLMPPSSGAFPFPEVLSDTGAFSDVQNAIPTEGLIPFTVNSPLWSDGALKSRWLAVPNDGPPYSPDEQINFAPAGEWTFPDGTVFVKEFDLVVNESTQERKRLETRLLVRDENGEVYGVTYKWRPDNSDADLLPGGLDEDIPIVTVDGGVRIQRWTYPSRSDCLSCHNQPARYVLGVKTHQLNGELTYPSTGRTDNQLRTLNHLGMLNPSLNEADISSYLRSVPVTDSTVPIQLRMRSWIDSNCSQCHRPEGFCPSYDARFYTPLPNQNLINTFVRFRDLEGSELYQRDNALDATKMPPLAKNLVHEAAMTVLRQWIASPMEILSVYLHQDSSHLAVRFNSVVDPATAADPSHYSLDQGAIITDAVPGDEPDTVILTVSSLFANQPYLLTSSDVQDTAPSANTIWPGTQFLFHAQLAPDPKAKWLANISARVETGAGDNAVIAGFIARGGPDKRVIIRAIGPSLTSNGIAQTVIDPTLDLYNSSGDLIASNDNWRENSNEQEIIDTGIPPNAESESAILMRLPSDAEGVAYTAVMRGAADSTGVGLLEVYDLDVGLGPDLLNISTRARVDVDDRVMIGGLIVRGAESQQIIVRALGPSLPILGNLSDPTLDLHDENGALLRSNDNWRSDQESEIMATTIPPANDLEAAIIATLPPASYTAIVRGVNGATGIALVEIYALN